MVPVPGCQDRGLIVGSREITYTEPTSWMGEEIAKIASPTLLGTPVTVVRNLLQAWARPMRRGAPSQHDR
jgi:hypothetical protein